MDACGGLIRLSFHQVFVRGSGSVLIGFRSSKFLFVVLDLFRLGIRSRKFFVHGSGSVFIRNSFQQVVVCGSGSIFIRNSFQQVFVRGSGSVISRNSFQQVF